MRVFASLLVLATSLVPAAAFAEKDFAEAGKAITYDCGEDPEVSISASATTFTLTGACKEINLSASKVTLVVAEVAEITISGTANKVTLTTVGEIQVSGSKNKVTWKKALTGKKPSVTATGVGNSIAKAK